ncbi:hypothetical protein FOZ60_004346 [Perkinsus olseni]|uniref:Uncharacterized protein n=1 Tax=Perkinsus olseni TaxID=32597 RepID=A0A7J6NT61_PEROL|nr:hypothetical protein FOZ60_004346 [Perkinsus olseni]
MFGHQVLFTQPYKKRAKARLRLDGWFTTLEEAEDFVGKLRSLTKRTEKSLTLADGPTRTCWAPSLETMSECQGSCTEHSKDSFCHVCPKMKGFDP